MNTLQYYYNKYKEQDTQFDKHILNCSTQFIENRITLIRRMIQLLICLDIIVLITLIYYIYHYFIILTCLGYIIIRYYSLIYNLDIINQDRLNNKENRTLDIAYNLDDALRVVLFSYYILNRFKIENMRDDINNLGGIMLFESGPCQKSIHKEEEKDEYNIKEIGELVSLYTKKQCLLNIIDKIVLL